MQIDKDPKSTKTHHIFHLRVEAAPFFAQVQTRLETYQKNASIKGFRKGRVPLHVIKQHYQNKTEQDVLRHLLTQAIDTIRRDYALQPLMTPHIQAAPPKNQEGVLQATITLLTAHIPPIEYNSISINRYQAQPEKKDIDHALTQLQKHYRRFESISETRPPRHNERVLFDYTIQQDNKPEQKGSWTIDMVTPQAGLPTFQRQLITALQKHKKGEPVTIDTRIGDGKATHPVRVIGHITDIQQGYALKEQELLAAFNAESQKDLRQKIHAELQQQADHSSEQQARHELWQALQRTISIDLPEEYLARAQTQESTAEDVRKNKDYLRREALSYHIAHNNRLFPQPQDVESQMKALLKRQQEDKNHKAISQEEQERLYQRLYAIMTQNNVDQFLLKQVRILTHNVPFQQLMGAETPEPQAEEQKPTIIT